MNKIKIKYILKIESVSDYIYNFVYEKTYMSIPHWIIPSDCYEQ
jgi:hypothetical protein